MNPVATSPLPRVSAAEPMLQKVVLVVGRLALGYLFFTQLFWKLPPTFGCPKDFSFTTGTVDASGRVQLNRTGGLCDWIGIESVWAKAPHPILVPVAGPNLAVDIGPLARLNGLFIDSFVKPNIRWFGYVVWGMEAFIAVSLFFGLFSRLGGLVAIAQSAQLWVGLSGIATPYEWEWGYNLMLMLSILMFVFAPGRVLGVDQLLIGLLKPRAERENRLARALLWLM